MIDNKYYGGTIPVGIHVRKNTTSQQIDDRMKQITKIEKTFGTLMKELKNTKWNQEFKTKPRKGFKIIELFGV